MFIFGLCFILYLMLVQVILVGNIFLNFDDMHDNIIWSLMLFSISSPYSQYCANCRKRVMYCYVDSFSNCFAIWNINLSNGIFF